LTTGPNEFSLLTEPNALRPDDACDDVPSMYPYAQVHREPKVVAKIFHFLKQTNGEA
jgi:hypothetical protein